MNRHLSKHKQSITRTVLFAFVVSWFSLIGQASAHTFMMAEMQQHKAMGHDMSGHCQPVLCESVISLDDQTGHGLDAVKIIDLHALPAVAVLLPLYMSQYQTIQPSSRWFSEYDPPPLVKTGILRI